MNTDILTISKLVFWDFDGVIKESVSAKSDAFERLFSKYGLEVAKRVRKHHEENSGISRFEKIPLYIKWAGHEASPDRVKKFCDRFAILAKQAVIDSKWVEGVREYLEANHNRQIFILVTATPQEEIMQILEELGIDKCFKGIYGAPKPKRMAITDALALWSIKTDETVMVGDSKTDYDAAAANNVPFLLRRTPINRELQKNHKGASFDRL